MRQPQDEEESKSGLYEPKLTFEDVKIRSQENLKGYNNRSSPNHLQED